VDVAVRVDGVVGCWVAVPVAGGVEVEVGFGVAVDKGVALGFGRVAVDVTVGVSLIPPLHASEAARSRIARKTSGQRSLACVPGCCLFSGV
jgi:hypothetical protein